jgi:hypothetical protein
MVHTKCLYITEVFYICKAFTETSQIMIFLFSTAYDANFKLMAIGYWSRELKKISLLKDQGINGKILKQISKKQGEKMWTGLT